MKLFQAPRVKLLLVMLLFLPQGGWAGESLKVVNAWLAVPPPGAQVMAGYFEVINPTNKEVKFVKITGHDFADLEFHENKEEGGQVRMVKLDSLVVPAKGRLKLSPGGAHLMLFEFNKKFKKGDKSKFVLKTATGLSVKFTAQLKDRNSHSNHQHH